MSKEEIVEQLERVLEIFDRMDGVLIEDGEENPFANCLKQD